MPKITAMMTVRNEAERYLGRCLTALESLVDEIVILDDASTDATPEICSLHRQVRLHRRDSSLFTIDEALLRQELWHYTADTEPEWILAIDADEFLEERAATELSWHLRQDIFHAVGFRLFDCWADEDHYRADGLWNPWLRGFSAYLVRYRRELPACWPALKFHCGRLPLAYRRLPLLESDLRIKHLGWVNPADVRFKYQRALAQDPDFVYMSREHYQSIILPTEKIMIRVWEK